jgi:NAD(P)H-hydrate epimerase
MRVLSATEMREADRRAIEELGIPSRTLMENAGRGVVSVMEREIKDLARRSIAIVCGKGNNGGDGLVALRELAGRGYKARAFLLARFNELTGDAAANLETARAAQLPVEQLPDEEAWQRALGEIAGAGVIVDAILGTGLSRAPRGLPETAIRELNRLGALRVAVDLPSGISSDTGQVLGEALRADLTVALAAPKVGHFLPPACFNVGKLEVVDIGIPAAVLQAVDSRIETIELQSLRGLLPPRAPDAHKGDFGHLLVLAGSVGKTGAAVMAARAASRCGVGLVTVAAPATTLPVIAAGAPEMMTEPLPETPQGTIALTATSRALELLEGKSALVLGPGLGRHPETSAWVKRILAQADVPMLVDADALNALEGDIDAVPRGRPLALTPHPGEMARLLGTTSAAVQTDRLSAARKLAREREVHVLLKGYRSLVAEPAGRIGINLTGNPGMATGGAGDVLSGMAGAFLAQGLGADAALRLAAHLHGLAGDLAAAEVGQTALIATDLIGKLPECFRRLGAP